MLFLNPLASTIKFWTLFFSGRDFLSKSILTWCVGGVRGLKCNHVFSESFSINYQVLDPLFLRSGRFIQIHFDIV